MTLPWILLVTWAFSSLDDCVFDVDVGHFRTRDQCDRAFAEWNERITDYVLRAFNGSHITFITSGYCKFAEGETS